jgi:hypothetical protein
VTAPAKFPPLTIAAAAAAALGLLALMLTPVPATLFGGGAATAGVAMPQAPSLSAVEIPAFVEFRAIAEKPLFNPGRAPDPSAPDVAAKSALAPLSDYRLAGVVLSGDTKLALVERRQSKQTVTLRPGDTLDGRHVDAIAPDGVHMSGGPAPELMAMPRVPGISRSGPDAHLSRHR